MRLGRWPETIKELSLSLSLCVVFRAVLFKHFVCLDTHFSLIFRQVSNLNSTKSHAATERDNSPDGGPVVIEGGGVGWVVVVGTCVVVVGTCVVVGGTGVVCV